MATANINVTIQPISALINAGICCEVAQAVAKRKGWNEDHLRAVLIEFVTCGEDVTLRDFLEAAE